MVLPCSGTPLFSGAACALVAKEARESPRPSGRADCFELRLTFFARGDLPGRPTVRRLVNN